MNAAALARQMGPREFIALCAYLDNRFGERARYFEVLALNRDEPRMVILLADRKREELDANCQLWEEFKKAA